MPDTTSTVISSALDELEAHWHQKADELYRTASEHAIGALDGDISERILAKERLAEARTLELAISGLQKVRAAASIRFDGCSTAS